MDGAVYDPVAELSERVAWVGALMIFLPTSRQRLNNEEQKYWNKHVSLTCFINMYKVRIDCFNSISFLSCSHF